MPGSVKKTRTSFTEEDDENLVQFLAVYNPVPGGRTGGRIYKILEDNAENMWAWSTRHSWQSWRDHYRLRQGFFDSRIKRYQKQRARPNGGTLGLTDEGPEALERKRKRDRLSDGRKHGDKRTKLVEDIPTETRALSGREESEESAGHEMNAVVQKGDIENVVGEDEHLAGKLETSEFCNRGQSQTEALEGDELDEHFKIESQVDGEERKIENDAPAIKNVFNLSKPIAPNTEVSLKTSIATMNARTPPAHDSRDTSPITPEQSTVKEESQSDVMQPSIPSKKIKTQVQKSKKIMAELFGTPTPSPPTQDRVVMPVKKRRPPILVEGHYGNVFARKKHPDTSDTEESDTQWPPARKKVDQPKVQVIKHSVDKHSLDKGKRKVVYASTNSSARVEQKEGHPRLATKEVIKPSTAVQTNAVASSSRVKLPVESSIKERSYRLSSSPVNVDSALQRDLPPTTGRVDAKYDAMVIDDQENHEGNLMPKGSSKSSHNGSDRVPRGLQTVQVPSKDRVSRSSNHKEKMNGDFQISSKQKVVKHTVSGRPAGQSITVPSDDPRNHNQAYPGVSSIPDDPFYSTSTLNLGVLTKPKANPSNLIDLRREAAMRRLSSRSTSVMSAPSVNQNGSTLFSVVLPPEEQEMLIRRAIESISKNHGFTEEVVWNTFLYKKSIIKTEKVIRQMRIKAEEALLATSDNEEDVVESESVPAMAPSVQAEEIPKSITKHNKKGPILNVRPLLNDDAPVEYTPPSESRAGQFTRLLQRGREDEALERENRRASIARGPLIVPTPSPSKSAISLLSGSPLRISQTEKSSNPSNVTIPWKEEYGTDFARATAETADNLRELEHRLDQDDVMRWMVEYHSKMVKSI